MPKRSKPETPPEPTETEALPQPAGMPRALFEKLKKAHVEADALDKATLIDLLETLVEREEAAEAAHPAESEFASLIGLDAIQNP